MRSHCLTVVVLRTAPKTNSSCPAKQILNQTCSRREGCVGSYTNNNNSTKTIIIMIILMILLILLLLLLLLISNSNNNTSNGSNDSAPRGSAWTGRWRSLAPPRPPSGGQRRYGRLSKVQCSAL